MDNSSELIIVDKKVLPEVFTKVLQVKELEALPRYKRLSTKLE